MIAMTPREIEIEILAQSRLEADRMPVRRFYIAPNDVEKSTLQQKQNAAPRQRAAHPLPVFHRLRKTNVIRV